MSITRISTISKNYACALLETFEDKELAKTMLKDVLDTISSSNDLKVVLANSSISHYTKLQIIDEIFKSKVDDKILNFIKILIEKQRINELNEIYQAIVNISDENSNRKTVEIISSIELDDTTKEKIINSLNKKLNCDIQPDWQTDEKIIAGLIFKYDDYVIDTSILAKLKKLSKQ